MEEIKRTETFQGSSTKFVNLSIQREINKWMNNESAFQNAENANMYTKEDIEKFAFAVAEIQNDFSNNIQGTRFSSYTGLFLSALINIHHEKTKNTEEYIIHTSQFDYLIENVGYKNTADIKVIGDVGDFFCTEMISGNVHLDGNALDGACLKMENGNVTINGNVENYFCSEMRGGTAILKGSARGEPAKNMYDGNVHIYGNTSSACTGMKGGTVIVEGNDTDGCAYRMHGGKLTIKGNVGNYPAFGAQNCYIHIAGNAGDNVGIEMKSGVLRIDGNVGMRAGNDLDGGTIYLNGDYESIARTARKGRIYAKGKQVFPYMENDLVSQMWNCIFKW